MLKGAIALGMACALNMGMGQNTFKKGDQYTTGEVVGNEVDGTKCACVGANNKCYELKRGSEVAGYLETDAQGRPVSTSEQ